MLFARPGNSVTSSCAPESDAKQSFLSFANNDNGVGPSVHRAELGEHGSSKGSPVAECGAR